MQPYHFDTLLFNGHFEASTIKELQKVCVGGGKRENNKIRRLLRQIETNWFEFGLKTEVQFKVFRVFSILNLIPYTFYCLTHM